MAPTIHPTAHVSEDAEIGEGTYVWHEVQIREGAKIGRDCRLGKCVYIDKDVEIGDNCKIQNRATVYQGVKVGNNVFIGPHVVFTNDLYPRAISSDWKVVPTIVKDGSSIGANATILCGIRIGEYAMIGAGSVVTRNVEPHELIVGNPAKRVGYVCHCGRKLLNHHCSHCDKKVNIGAYE
ncbi:MAG: N-acetyltransferase [Thermoplasmata archaeon]|nr:N-acetyltransferase [Thermoplasmata archaeon]